MFLWVPNYDVRLYSYHRQFYAHNIYRENIHSETYSLLLNTLIRDPLERSDLFTSIETIPAIRAKANWCIKWIEDNTLPFATRLLAFAAVEGIFFSSSFASIFWLKKRGLMPGLCFSNELICRDEGLHTEFAALLYSKLLVKPSQDIVNGIVTEAVRLEKQFFSGKRCKSLYRHSDTHFTLADALPAGVLGMNANLMHEYIEFVADNLLGMMSYSILFGTKNPVCQGLIFNHTN